jgi:hypothetical protein
MGDEISGSAWIRGQYEIGVGAVPVPGRVRMHEQQRFLVGSESVGRIQLGPRVVVTPSGDALKVRGSRSSTQLVSGYSVVAAVTSVSGRAWRAKNHSMRWEIAADLRTAAASVMGDEPMPGSAFDVSVSRSTERRTVRDAVKGSAVLSTSGVMRDTSGMDVLTVETTYSVRRIGTSLRPLGARMYGSFDGRCRALSTVPLSAVALALYLILRPEAAVPSDGEWVMQGG